MSARFWTGKLQTDLFSQSLFSYQRQWSSGQENLFSVQCRDSKFSIQLWQRHQGYGQETIEIHQIPSIFCITWLPSRTAPFLSTDSIPLQFPFSKYSRDCICLKKESIPCIHMQIWVKCFSLNYFFYVFVSKRNLFYVFVFKKNLFYVFVFKRKMSFVFAFFIKINWTSNRDLSEKLFTQIFFLCIHFKKIFSMYSV